VNEPLSPRATALLFARALRYVDQIQPHTVRESIAAMLEAGVEECTISSESLLGHRLNHLIRLADALIEAGQGRLKQ
jgi:hypothetical protein